MDEKLTVKEKKKGLLNYNFTTPKSQNYGTVPKMPD